MYYENIFYDDVINRLADILITKYDECQPKSKSKSQANDERFYAISSEKYDYYKILGISKNADPNEIKKAYHRTALLCHPDIHLNKDRKQEADENFKKVSRAYTTLSNPEERKIYDSNYHNIIENEEPKEESEISKKRQTMEQTALWERSIIVLSKHFRDILNKRGDKKRAKLEAEREAEEKAEREAEEKAEREAIQKAKKEATRERKRRMTARMQNVKGLYGATSLLSPIRMFTRKKNRLQNKKEVAPYDLFTSASQPHIGLNRSVPTTSVYV